MTQTGRRATGDAIDAVKQAEDLPAEAEKALEDARDQLDTTP